MDAFVTRRGIQITDPQSQRNESTSAKRFKSKSSPWKDRMECNARSVLIYNTTSKAMEKLKVAAFDLDHTLIVTKSGKRFPRHAKDWKFFHPKLVKDTILQLNRDDFAIVIVSNQLGISQGKSSEKDIKEKIEAICCALETPMLALLAIRDDRMRKPRPGIWEVILDELGVEEDKVDKKSSFYCGDAAGRPAFGNRKKDFAATDYKFAMNCGIAFQTPEALFLKTKARIHTQSIEWDIGFDPKSLLALNLNTSSDISSESTQEIVVLVGSPASGKSFLARNYFPDYEIVNQDIERTTANCIKRCLKALKEGKSVVIDATNRDPATRKVWVGIACEQKTSIRCIQIEVSKELALHLNKYRQLGLPELDTQSQQILAATKAVPDIAIHSFYKSFIPPNQGEGFTEVIRVPFCMQSHQMTAIQKSYMSYYLA